jgi:hypothetical protein
MFNLYDRVRDSLRKDIEHERSLDRPIEDFSLLLWPYPESKLIFYISLLAILDYASTYTALNLSGNSQVAEVGLMAKWALQCGGFPRLLLVDAIAIGTLIFLAVIARYMYGKLGLKGFGRAAFVFLLVPYLVFICGVVVNNVLVAFL